MRNSKKIIITEAQFQQMLLETMGVSDAIQKASEKLYQLFLHRFSSKEGFEYINDPYNFSNDIIKNYRFSFDKIDVLGMDVRFQGLFRNFMHKDFFEKANQAKNVIFFDGNSVYFGRGKGEIFVSLCAISGKINKENAIDTISHELTHLYQEYLCEQSYYESTRDKQKKRSKIFNYGSLNARCRTDMVSSNENIRDVGRLMYICIGTEISANINGMYAYGMSSTSPYSFDLIKSTPAWKFYEEGVYLLGKLKGNEEMQHVLKSRYGLFSIGRIDGILGDYKNRICRAALLIRDGKNKQGWRC